MLPDILTNLNATRSAMLLNPTDENRLAYRSCFAAWSAHNRGKLNAMSMRLETYLQAGRQNAR